MRNKWDKKARHYGRYSANPEELESAVFNLLGDMDVVFDGASVVDIGCGTGVYTLHIAAKAKDIDAIDMSPEMLKILRDDALKHNISNINTYQSSWDDFDLPEMKYDYALSTMSPATKEAKGFEKMHQSARTKIFLGWGDKRGTDLIEQLFEAHGHTYTPPNGAVHLRNWLKRNNIKYTLREHIETKIRTKEFTQAVDKYAWHLEARGMKPDRDKIKSILSLYLDQNGFVVEKVKNYFNLIAWD